MAQPREPSSERIQASTTPLTLRHRELCIFSSSEKAFLEISLQLTNTVFLRGAKDLQGTFKRTDTQTEGYL